MDLSTAATIGEETQREFKKTKDVVLYVLENSERARNEDTYLIFRVLSLLGENIEVVLSPDKKVVNYVWTMKELKSIASFETITRCRREVQNTLCLWPPTSLEVALKRRIREAAVRKFYGDKTKII